MDYSLTAHLAKGKLSQIRRTLAALSTQGDAYVCNYKQDTL